ncbi:MAG TPA: S8 family serine peptidase [Candidatus Thermoplasmatota archaeon]|nr:S8 family serine peptidase [Candidatus Thermoplasmatota archaeon]
MVSSAGVLLGPAHGSLEPSLAGTRDWALDADGNGLDDALDRALAEGAAGLAYLHVHYDRRPTADDARLLETQFGALRTYVFRNWDDIQVEIPYARAAGLATAPGVWGVELLPPMRLDLAVATPATRVTSSTVPTFDGLNHLLSAHGAGFRGEGIVIAILDTGIDNTHLALDDLDDNPLTIDPKLVTGADFSPGMTGVGCVDPDDMHVHGTHVAGIAAGTTAGGLLPTGVAPKAKLVDIRVLTAGGIGLFYPTGLGLALDWILDYNAGVSCYGPPGADRIDVASLSLSVDNGHPHTTIAQKVNTVVRSGVVVVFSAGNAGPNSGTLTKGPDGAILVANSDTRGTVSRHDDIVITSSSRGPRLSDGDTDFLDELRPDVSAPGTAIQAALARSGVGTVGLTGTSMAAPHVAGVVALLLQANPALAPVDLGNHDRMGEVGAVPVRDLLQWTATRIGTQSAPQATRDGKFGLTWDNAQGYGLVDAYAGVQAALSPPAFPLVASTDGPARIFLGTSGTLRGMAHGGTGPYLLNWHAVSVPAGSALSGWTAAGGSVTFTPDVAGSYTVRLNATDATSAWADRLRTFTT